ncbi:MAG: flagellar M-ring protein FliF [Proteobacteria bacterium]|nr:flagellar M-ring protein FliF [Pseudomonadota bacterium]
MNQLLQTLRGLGPMRLAALAGMILAVIVFFGFLTSKMASGPMALLYSNLDPADGGAIIAQLESQKIPYEVSGNGTSLKVPSEQVGRIRMEMAQAGLPRGGSIGYEIFDQKDGFSTTSFVQNINHLRALEGELARTISTLTPIQAARVHLVLPRREMFSQAEQKATASVFLKMRAAASLSKEQVAAVRQLIAAAVPNLQSENVSIVDDHGNLLAKMAGNGDAGADASNHEEIRMAYEKVQSDKIEELLSRSLGYGKARAQVSVEMDFDRVSTSSEIFDPESQVVRSTQNVSDEGSSSEGATGGGVSVAGNLPAGQAAGGGGSNANKNNHSEETVNYEINKTMRTQVRESGSVKKQTVAVLVDGVTTKDKDGKETYTPRTKEELEQIKTLVKSAVNIDATRGDTLEVVNMPFVSASDGQMTGNEGIMGFANADLLRMVESLLLAVVGLLAILLVVRPILKQVLEGATATVGGTGGTNLLTGTAGGGGTAKLPPPGGALAAQLSAESSQEDDQLIDITRVEGRVKASSLRKVGEIVEKHPEEAVSILRNWIYQEN